MAYHYIKKRGEKYVIVNKEGKVISTHATRAKAQASFRAMMSSKYGSKRGRR